MILGVPGLRIIAVAVALITLMIAGAVTYGRAVLPAAAPAAEVISTLVATASPPTPHPLPTKHRTPATRRATG